MIWVVLLLVVSLGLHAGFARLCGLVHPVGLVREVAVPSSCWLRCSHSVVLWAPVLVLFLVDAYFGWIVVFVVRCCVGRPVE